MIGLLVGGIERLRTLLVGLPRRVKRLLQLLADLLLVWGSLWLAFAIRLGDIHRVEPLAGHLWLFMAAPLIAIPLYVRSGMYRAVLRYMGNEALLTIFKAVTLSSLLLALLVYWIDDDTVIIPRSMIFNYWWLSLFFVGGLRLLMRQFFLGGWFVSDDIARFLGEDKLPKVAIYGAGQAGNQLVAALRQARRVKPVAFVDDNGLIANRMIAGLKVYKPKHLEQMFKETGATEVLLAIPSASRSRRREIITMLERYAVHVRSVPGIMDLASGRVRVEDVREVDISDLLGRDVVVPQADLFGRCITGKVVMVSGAGGSIGSELCRQIISLQPARLILFEHSEYALYRIHQELVQLLDGDVQGLLVPLLGTVRNYKQLQGVMRAWRVQTLYHAAAYKHVPLVEQNIVEGVINNVLGTLYMAEAAISTGVENFVLISTDKAVRPTNVMGASKRFAEMLLQALSQETHMELFTSGEVQVRNTCFCMVRFGNVLGSSGSVIPLFREQIARGGPVTVTHPDVTRYFMTIPEAAQLVIQAGGMARGGDIFVLDMGDPVRIAELAERMISLSGFTVRSEVNPKGDVAIEYRGLRPGEKLYEELLIDGNACATEHPMICAAQDPCLDWQAMCVVLVDLCRALDAGDSLRTREILCQAVENYVPAQEFFDLARC